MEPILNHASSAVAFLASLAWLFFTTIVIKYIVVKWVAEKTRIILFKMFVKSSRDLAVWLHYFNRRVDKGHQHPLPKCDDGQCAKF